MRTTTDRHLTSLTPFHIAAYIEELSKERSAPTVKQALDVEMATAFRPTAANFFSRVGKSAILAAFTEATGNPPPPAWRSMKKVELATAAERDIGERTAWLPEPMRIGPVAVDEPAEYAEWDEGGGNDDA